MKTELSNLSTHDRHATDDLIDRLSEAFPSSVVKITLFGSKARGDDNEDSDIDVLVVLKDDLGDKKMEIWGLGARVSLKWDVLFNLFSYSQERWEWMASIRHPLWRSITSEGIDLTPELAAA